jgi:hypothetical protein
MNSVGNDTNQQQTKHFWKDYNPTEKMSAVMIIFTIIYSVTTIGLYWTAVGQFDGMKKEQRPWMQVLAAAQADEGTTVQITSYANNTGKSPAKSLDIEYYIEEVKNGLEPKLDKASRVGRSTTGVFYPNGPTQSNFEYDLLKAGSDDFKEARMFLVIYGHITYTDVFRTEHWADFCGFINSPKYKGLVGAKKCTSYNDTDNN